MPKLKIDENLGKADIFRLVNTFRKVNPNDNSAIEMITIPVEASDDGAQVVLEAAGRRLGARPPADVRRVDERRRSTRSCSRPRSGSGCSTARASTAPPARRSPSSSSTASPRRASATPGISRPTEIHYRPGQRGQGAAGGRATCGASGKLVADDSISDADVVVVLGQDFKGVKKLDQEGPAGDHDDDQGARSRIGDDRHDDARPADRLLIRRAPTSRSRARTP